MIQTNVIAVFFLILSGCSPKLPANMSTGDAAPRLPDMSTGDTGPPPVLACTDGVKEWEYVKASYGNLVHVAGTGGVNSGNKWLPKFEGGPATMAALSRPHMAMADAAGNIFIADKEAHAVRMVSPAGIISTVAGTGAADDDGDASGPAREKPLYNPNGLFVLPDGTLYIVDLDNKAIRKVTPEPNRQMSTLFRDPEGFGAGRGLYVEQNESEVFYSASTVVRRWTKQDGRIENFAGPFVDLGMVVKDRTGRLLVGSRGGQAVFAVTREPGKAATITRVTTTALNEPRAVWPAFDTAGFFVGTHRGSQVFYVDCTGMPHLFLDGSINEVRSVTLDAAGNIIIVENDRGYVRMVKRR